MKNAPPFIAKKVLTIIVFIGCSVFCFQIKAQPSLATLQAQLASADLDNYRLILEALDSTLHPLPPSQAIAHAQENLEIARNTKEKQIVCLSKFYLLRTEASKLEKNNLNLPKFLELLNYAQEHDFKYEIALIYQTLARIYNLAQVPSKSLYYAEASIQTFESLALHDQLVKNYVELGLALHRVKEYEKAKGYLHQALRHGLSSLTKRRQINTFNALGLSYFHLSHYDSALIYLAKAIRLAQKYQDSLWVGILQGNQGQVYGKMKKYDLAQELLAQDIEVSLRYHVPSNAIISLTYSGDFYYETNQIAAALARYQEGLRLSKNPDAEVSYAQLVSLHRGVAQCYQKLDQAIAAQAHLEQALAYQDSLLREKQSEEYQTIRKVIDSEKKERQVANLTIENRQQKDHLAKEHTRQHLLLVTLLAISLCVVIFFLSNRQHRRKNVLLQNRNQTISQQKFIIQQKNEEIAQRNQELSKKNLSLEKQKEENLHQKNLIQAQYNELKLVHEKLQKREQALSEALDQIQEKEKLILKQNQQLKDYNQNLEAEIQARTQEISNKNQELIHYNNQLEQLSFMAAHNLRSPVANLIGLCSLVKQEKVFSTEASLYIDKIEFTSQRLSQIISDINNLLEVRKNIPQPIEEINLKAIATHIFQMLASEVEAAQAQITYHLEPSAVIPSIRMYWESILYNLISNALKYRSPLRPLKIEMGAYQAKNRRIIYVKDNGLGIDLAKYGQDLFGLYKRFHSKIEGKGMGLHLVKLQVEALGGQIQALSQPDQGTTFEISLPLSSSV